METVSSSKDKKNNSRRSNAERSAETRQRVIDATVRCLCKVGYQNTSINTVAENAGVSKGATQHQFPTKVTLMIATAKFCTKAYHEYRLELLSQLQKTDHDIGNWADISWDALRHPTYGALLEIFVATRNDSELKKQMRPISNFFQKLLQQGVEPFCQMAGIDPDPLVFKMIRAHVIFTRGIATGLMFSHDPDSLREDLDTIKLYEQLTVDMIKKKQGKAK